MSGSYETPVDVDPYVQGIIDIIKRGTEKVRPESIYIPFYTEDYSRYWRKEKESTSPNTSGIHFVHWKE